MDKSLQYKNKDYQYIDYTVLSERQQLEILEWRNDPRIRQLMASEEIISRTSHFKFIDSLKNREDKKYWLVRKDNDSIGTFNITVNDSDPLTCEPGYYLKPSLLDCGLGLDFHHNYKDFLFNVLGFQRMTGYILEGNENAYIIAKFFGSQPYGIYSHNGKIYISMALNKDDFNRIEDVNLTLQFAKFFKQNKNVNWKELIETFK